MAELKTQKSSASVAAFLATIAKIMREVTGAKPAMWGTGIIGYGSYHYRYASGREGGWFRTGFSPRKGSFSLYIMDGFRQREPLLKKLGKHKIGKACL